MPNILRVDEADFQALSDAANDALERGQDGRATVLDKLARKANAALSNARMPWPRRKSLTWRDVPSTLSREPFPEKTR